MYPRHVSGAKEEQENKEKEKERVLDHHPALQFGLPILRGCPSGRMWCCAVESPNRIDCSCWDETHPM